jgi:hypothetical protein
LNVPTTIAIPKHDHIGAGQIIGQKKDQDGDPIGRLNPDPVLDTRILEVQFPDGDVQEYGANVIAEHLYSQVDDKGHHYLLFVDHRKDGSAVAADGPVLYRQTWCETNASNNERLATFTSKERRIAYMDSLERSERVESC